MIHMDLDEGRYARLSCVACHYPEAEITMTPTYLVYALDCEECGARLVTWDAL